MFGFRFSKLLLGALVLSSTLVSVFLADQLTATAVPTRSVPTVIISVLLYLWGHAYTVQRELNAKHLESASRMRKQFFAVLWCVL